MPNWNLTPEIPELAVSLRSNYPARTSWDLMDDGGYDGRSGDLVEVLELARDNDQVVELQPGATYEQSRGVSINGVGETGLVCNEDDPATVVYTGTDSSYLWSLPHSSAGVDRMVLQGVEYVFEGGADAGVISGLIDTEFWSKGVALSSQRDRNYGQRGGYTWAPMIADPSGTGYVEGLSMMEGDYIRPDTSFGNHSIGVSTDPPHRGTIVYWGDELSGFGDNNFYMSNAPRGRAILVDCYSADCRGGAFRLGTNDEIIGGLAEQHNGPVELGPGHCLSAYYGPPRRFVGVTCRGDLYGNAMALSRDAENGTPSTTLDRCVFHVDGNNASPLLRLQGGAEWTFEDCYIFDESDARSSFSGEPDITAHINNGTINSDSTLHWTSPNNEYIRLESPSAITHEGDTWTGYDDVSIHEIGYNDATPLPEPHFGGGGGGDPGDGQADRLVIARNSATQERESDVEVWVRPR